jgi:hypothetical protein
MPTAHVAATALALAAVASAPLAAQDAAESRDGACFGVSFDRGCFAMLQYEGGYRVAAAGRAPRFEHAYPRERKDRSQLFLAGGIVFAVSPTTTLGAIYDRGTGDGRGTESVGVRWGRHLRAGSRVDVTAGAVSFPLNGDSASPSHRATSYGAFTEVALHGTNLLTVVARDELYPRRADAASGNLVFVGARAEAMPAAVLTLIGIALIGIGMSLTGPGW